MRLPMVFGLLVLTVGFTHFAVAQPECSPSSYYCLDPAGTEFGIVGPVNMWFSRAERACIPSPHSKGDGCLYITKLCNSAYPQRCNGDCIAGHVVGYVLEKSCRGSIPLSPPSSEPDARHEIWFIQDSAAVPANPYPRQLNRYR